MERGDWETLFASLDATSLRTLARNSLTVLLNAPAGTPSPVDANAMQALRERSQAIVASAQHVMATQDTAERMRRSLMHKALVEEHQALMDATLKAIANLPAMAAHAERTLRATTGGGTVSSSLFVGETLEDISVDGNKARAVRRTPRGYTENVAFVCKRGTWFIKLIGNARI